MRAVIYSRVSTESQDYTRQIEELTKIVKVHGNELVTVYSEKDSAVKEDAKRYELNKLIKAANNKEFDIVYFWEISRLYRNVFKTDKFLLKLEELGINAFFKEPQSLFLLEDGKRSFVADIQITLHKHIAEQESKIKKERQKSGLLHKSKNNVLVHGKAPFGYIKENKVLKVDDSIITNISGYETKPEVIKRIFELYASGDSIRKIAKHLNDLKIVKNWEMFQVRNILVNTSYYGIRKSTIDNIEIEQIVPSIITRELFEECSSRLESNLHGKGATKRKTEALLQGKVYCGSCGRRYSIGQRVKYRCSGYQYVNNPCHNPVLKLDNLDSCIWKIIESDYLRYNNLENKAKLLKGVNDSIEILKRKIEVKNENIKTCKNDIEKLIDVLLSVSSGSIKNRIKQEESNLLVLQEELENLNKEHVDVKLQKKRIESSNDEEQIRATTFNEKRKAIDKLINKILVYKLDSKIILQIYYYNGVVLNVVYNPKKPLDYIIFDNSLFTLVPETNLFRVEGIKALPDFNFETVIEHHSLEETLKMI